MTQRIIDHFEPVEIDHHQGRVRPLGFECLGQALMQPGAVGKVGDRIGRRELAELAAHVAQLFGMYRALPVNEGGQQGQRDICDKNSGQNGH